MRTSQFFFTTLKEAPTDAEVISQKLMLRAGSSSAPLPAFTPGCRSACACCARLKTSFAKK
jgi:hypothetical protein